MALHFGNRENCTVTVRFTKTR